MGEWNNPSSDIKLSKNGSDGASFMVEAVICPSGCGTENKVKVFRVRKNHVA